MIKQLVLNYIRNNMSDETKETRNEIFQAINEGCAKTFAYEDLQTRLSFEVGELIRNDAEFCDRAADVEIRRHVSRACAAAIAVYRG